MIGRLTGLLQRRAIPACSTTVCQWRVPVTLVITLATLSQSSLLSDKCVGLSSIHFYDECTSVAPATSWVATSAGSQAGTGNDGSTVISAGTYGYCCLLVVSPPLQVGSKLIGYFSGRYICLDFTGGEGVDATVSKPLNGFAILRCSALCSANFYANCRCLAFRYPTVTASQSSIGDMVRI